MHFVKHLLSAALLGTVFFSATARAAATFDLFEFAVEGNSVLADVDIERAVYPSLGPGRTAADVEKARAALEAAYQQSGYLSVSVVVPEQSVADGVIRLQVIEGQVERLKVSGNRYTARSDLRAEVPALAAGSVPHFPTMQAELAQASRSPDRRVTPLLRPGVRPGTMEVELAVEDELPLHGNVELNNRQSPDTSPLRLEAGIRYANLFQKQHSAGLNYVVAPENPDEVSVLAAFYNAPLSATRSLSTFVQHSNSNIATSFGSTVLGKGTTFGARFSQTLPQPAGIANFFHSLSLGMDFKNLAESQNALGADKKDTPLRYTPLVAQYTFSNFGESGEFTGNLSLVVNLNTSSRRVDCQGVDMDQFECRRAYARAGFSVVRGDLSYSKRLLGWEGMSRLDFQISSQPLVSPEQILAGGMDSVRSYYEGETAGDAGWRLRGEIKTPTLIAFGDLGLRAIGFVEGARLWLNSPLPGQTSEFSLASAGFGLRLKGEKGGPLLVVDAGQALKAGPRTEKGAQRVHVRLGYEF
ncbi:ShlB/FhaC/HecB family hemolysin secretion/activation protein [Dechloromonas denitrificans]|uniref:ShlB/FhaC/HecB family hemolysin secretion/activation protein n=1 Tax=Dechloromonas denitrificans TaxID=281362 RepID=UPI001CF8594F|nr:POTRA domain-containing protein [Dechloromonas denitrificans]UCV05447.1 ShlB/FhaC/HecB family hemolysin secretion/activation protein [Dechloromonas denitrificans]